MSAPLVFASKKTPTIIGKPNKIMMDAIIAEYVPDRHCSLAGIQLTT